MTTDDGDKFAIATRIPAPTGAEAVHNDGGRAASSPITLDLSVPDIPVSSTRFTLTS